MPDGGHGGVHGGGHGGYGGGNGGGQYVQCHTHLHTGLDKMVTTVIKKLASQTLFRSGQKLEK